MIVFDWQDKTTWLKAITTATQNCQDEQYRDWFTEEDLEWPLDQQSSGLFDNLPFLLRLASYLFRCGARIRLYHATRTSRASSFFSKGIIFFPKEHLVENLQLVIGDKLLPDRDYYCQGEIYAVIDPRELIDTAGHYLIYGSEYQISLLGAGSAALELMTQIGTPTFIQIDMPLDQVPRHSIPELLHQFVSNISEYRDQVSSDTHQECHCLIFKQPISPEHVTGHFHPNNIHNPFTFQQYRWELMDCDVCNDKN